MAQVKAMSVLSRQLPHKRKRKKRKKRKLPHAPLPRGGRPCALQRQVPAVQVVHVLEGAPASVHRQSAGFPCCAMETWYPQCYCTEDRLVPSGTVLGQSRAARVVQRQLLRSLVQKTRGVSTGAFLGQGDMPVVILSDAFGQTAQKTVVVPQLQFFVSRRHSFRDAEADPHGPDYSADHRDLAFAVHFWWSMSLLCGSCKFSGTAVEKTFVLPQFQLVEKSPPVVPNHRCSVVQTAENCGVSAVAVHDGRRYSCRGAEAISHGLAVQQTIDIHQLQFFNEVIDVPVVPSRSHARCVQLQVPWFVLLINKVVYTLSSRRG